MVGICWTHKANLSNVALLLLFGGGAAYSVGAVLHARRCPPFHNAGWRALVLLGAILHWVAVAHQLVTQRAVVSAENKRHEDS